MNRSYRLGLAIVLGTILLSLGLVLAGEAFAKRQPPARNAEDLGAGAYPLGSFRLTERSGREVTDADLGGDVWVAAFIFTRCPSSCPRISSVMKGMQAPLIRSGARLVSVTVDPEHDTPPVMARYADGLGADPGRWWFLTGARDSIYDLILHRFHLSVAVVPEEELKVSAEAVAHSDRLALVDRGNRVVGVFDSTDAEAVRRLLARAKRLASWARPLPAVNATLNGTCAVLLLVGWTFILLGWVRAHAACMIAGVAVSAAFLACYLAYHYEAGSVAFQGTGGTRVVYRTILLSHTVLATFGVVPLVAVTLYRAATRQFDKHARVARVTFPIWFYVSVTGVVIYWMLYQMPLDSAGVAGPTMAQGPVAPAAARP